MPPTLALPDWNPRFAENAPIFEPLRPLAAHFSAWESWPDLNAYQALLDAQSNPPRSAMGMPLKVVEQGAEGHGHGFLAQYAPRIHARGELQTRVHNWHDFFQLLTWVLFPHTKMVINALHIEPARERFADAQARGRRSALENMLSLFDEGGAVICSDDPSLLQLIREFSWSTLFLQRRAELDAHLYPLVFGHALYEKGLRPYVGMTANTVLFTVEPQFFDLSQADRVQAVDRRLADLLSDAHSCTRPRDLHPFPILGLPGWDARNTDATFYANEDYFRSGRGAPAKRKG